MTHVFAKDLYAQVHATKFTFFSQLWEINKHRLKLKKIFEDNIVRLENVEDNKVHFKCINVKTQILKVAECKAKTGFSVDRLAPFECYFCLFIGYNIITGK